jgi:nucleotide-binding universal stress UspA family protein
MAYQHILVPVDGSKTAYAAIGQAADLAKAFNSKVTLVEVLTLDPYIAAEYITAKQTNEFIERARGAILTNLAEAKAKFSELGLDVETQLLEGQVISREIVKAAQTLQADLIVMGSHGRTGIKKLFLGSVAQSVLAEASAPVLIVRG